jgi:hypothetical protein
MDFLRGPGKIYTPERKEPAIILGSSPEIDRKIRVLHLGVQQSDSARALRWIARGKKRRLVNPPSQWLLG